MIIKTKVGLEVELNRDAFDDMEVLDAIRGMDEDNPIALSKFCDLVFSKQEKKKLYDFCRAEDGKVPLSKILDVITEIMTSLGQPEKN